MNVLVFSSKEHDRLFFERFAASDAIHFEYQPARLTRDTVSLSQHFDAVCVFVNDELSKDIIASLSALGVRHIALRCAGFNNVDLDAAKQFRLSVSRVPAYSPQAVSEHTFALMMALNRKTHKAYNRVRENNFSLTGLLGFNFCGRTIGVIGTGKIGLGVVNIALGLGCKVLCFDPCPDQSLIDKDNVEYTDLTRLLRSSDIISLHCPLNQHTHHVINHDAIESMKTGVMLINTSRGALIDTHAVINGLKSHKIGYLGLDVYEMESDLFFEDKSWEIIQDDVFERLVSFPNVIITGHQGFFTEQALSEIAITTLNNLELANKNTQNPTTFLC